MNEVEYHNMQESAEIGKFMDALIAAVRQRDQGRNQKCWSVLSFGGKDADLDPEGCTGIKAIRWKDEETLLVDVGGHKTVAYEGTDAQIEEQWDFLTDALWGLDADGDGEEITMSFAETLEVPQAYFKNRKGIETFSMTRTVTRIVKAAAKRCI